MRGSYFSAGGDSGSDVLSGASLRLSMNGAGVVAPHPVLRRIAVRCFFLRTLSPRRGGKVCSLPPHQRLRRKAFFAGRSQHAVDDGLLGRFLAGEDP
jgi:hypothetical protein